MNVHKTKFEKKKTVLWVTISRSEMGKKTYMYKLKTSFSRKVVGKSARDNPERYCGWFEFTALQRNLKEWHERSWIYVCEC